MKLTTLHEAWDWSKFGRGVGVGAALGAATLAGSMGRNKPPVQTRAVSPATRPTTQPTTKPAQATTKPTTQPSTRPATQPATQPYPNMTVARIIFSEAAGVTPAERGLVAGVIRNRVRNRAFGNAPNMEGVVTSRNAFEALNDPNNSNWEKSGNPESMTPRERQIWEQCLSLAAGNIPAANGESGRPLVYYHDKSISKPRSWDNQYWNAVRELETPSFIFYSVIPAPSR